MNFGNDHPVFNVNELLCKSSQITPSQQQQQQQQSQHIMPSILMHSSGNGGMLNDQLNTSHLTPATNAVVSIADLPSSSPEAAEASIEMTDNKSRSSASADQQQSQQLNNGGGGGNGGAVEQTTMSNMNVDMLLKMTHDIMERLNEKRRRDLTMQEEFRAAMTSSSMRIVDETLNNFIAARFDNYFKVITGKFEAIRLQLERLSKQESELKHISKQVELLYNEINK